MRVRTLVLLVLAVVLAGGTALLARYYLAQQRAAPVVAQQPKRSVLVARADLLRGQILRPDDMTWQVWPEGSLDKNYIVNSGPKKPQSFAGWVVVNPIASGEPMTAGNMIAPGDRGFLAAVLRPGMRAVSVPVTITTGIAGFIFPGDLVDLVLTYPIPRTESAGVGAGAKKASFEHKASETMMHNIRVIAIDQRLESKAGKAIPAHTATFEVTPKQSEVIALATELGKLSLSLHSLVGSGEVAKEPASSNSFSDGAVTYTVDSEISPLLPKFESGKDATETGAVTILRGARRTNEAADVSKDGGAQGAPTKPAGGT